jgi:hypothetical protein
MPRSKHRRKGKARQHVAFRAGPTVDDPALAALLADAEAGRAFDDPARDDARGMTEALMQAEEELYADLAAADFDDALDALDPEDRAVIESAMVPLRQAVQEQVRTNQPPEVAATLDRLVAAGLGRDAALALIAAAMLIEFKGMMQGDREYHPARYPRTLATLPELPGFD